MENPIRNIYLAGIKGIYTGSDSDIIDNSFLGYTDFDDNGNTMGSLIAHEAIINTVNSYVNLDYHHPEKEFISFKNLHQAVVIHELGHFVGKLHHGKDHNSIYCRMFQHIDQDIVADTGDI